MAKKNDCSNMSCRQKESSSSEDKGENAKLAIPDETVTPSKLVEYKIPKADLILSLDKLDDSQSKTLSQRKRTVESVTEVSEEKRSRVEQGIALILIASGNPGATIPRPSNNRRNPVATDVNQQITISTH